MCSECQQIVSAPSAQLTVEYGQATRRKVSALRREFSWTHFKYKTLHDSIRCARERLVVAEREMAEHTGLRGKAPATPRRTPKKGPKG